ncbi:MAG: hypothetical protein Q8P07_01380 [bacterium]|nr:hypothetical protein [bacterium]
MNKKLNVRAFYGIFIAFAVVFPLFSTTAATVPPQGEVLETGNLLFGQKHFYTVVFRGNGEAITYAKLVVINSGDNPLTDFSFQIPGVSPSEMTIFQMKLPQQCAQYNYNDPVRPCLEYRDPDYAQRYYYYGYSNGQAEYQKAEYSKSGDSYSFSLPAPVPPHTTTAFIIAYAAKGYVQNSFGLFKFMFETIKVPARIQEIRVAVDVDSDLLLKGKQSVVNYNTQTFGVGGQAISANPISSAELDKTVGSIGNGALVKSAMSLSPNETFLVRGEYAKSWWRLYLGSILLAVIIVAAIFAGLYFLRKFLKRKASKNTGSANVLPQQQDYSPFLNLTNVGIGLLSDVLAVAFTFLLQFLSRSNYFNFFGNEVFAIIFFIAILLLYVILLLVPAIFVASKHGWKSVGAILIFEFLWFVVLLLIYIGFFASVNPKNYPVMPL